MKSRDYSFLVLSDVHLENKSQIEQNFILETINSSLAQYRVQNQEPILVLPGDIHNGTQGIEWMKKIDAQIVYVCGNHEFWHNDYDEVRKNIKQQTQNTNIHFLDNDFVVLGDYLFVGGTMWTDVGQSLNPDLLKHAANTMNDVIYAKHEAWYDNSENVDKLKLLYGLNAEKKIQQKLWNVLSEQEENQKSLDYLKYFSQVHETLSLVDDIFDTLKQNVNTKSDYSKITQEQYQNFVSNLFAYKTGRGFKEWIDKLDSYTKNQKINPECFALQGAKQREEIFKKLCREDINQLKIVAVSHHLPFLEERLIGRQDWVGTQFEQTLFNSLNENLYLISKGDQYPMHNYFWQISKGEVTKDEAITQVVHYHNNGSVTFPPYLMDNVCAWVHGHEHHYNYEDYLKQVKIVTNPLGYSMSVFNYDESNDKFSLNERYKKYHKIDTQDDEILEIKKIQKTFLRPVSINLDKDQILSASLLWVLKHGQLDTLSKYYEHVERLNQNLLDSLIKHPMFESKISDTQWMSLGLVIDGIDLNTDKIMEHEKMLTKAYQIRSNPDYTFAHEHFGILKDHTVKSILQVLDHGLVKFERAEHPNMEWEYDMWMQRAFSNVEILKNAKVQLNKIVDALNDLKFYHLSEITPEMIDEFYNKVENVKSYKHYLKTNNIYEKLNEYKEAMGFEKKTMTKKYDF